VGFGGRYRDWDGGVESGKEGQEEKERKDRKKKKGRRGRKGKWDRRISWMLAYCHFVLNIGRRRIWIEMLRNPSLTPATAPKCMFHVFMNSTESIPQLRAAETQ
jgi:hypothetical protein